MGAINLYKIDKNKEGSLLKKLSEKLKLINNIEINVTSEKGEENCFGFTLYLDIESEKKELSWNWLLKQFNVEEITFKTSPKGVLVIEKNFEIMYAVTFGHSYFLVDKYCDRDFGFRFARKLKYKDIKTTTLTTPETKRNKVVNTYVNYSQLEFESGESFAKLKATQLVDEDFKLYKPSLEIGSSIRFSIETDSLENIARIINYVEEQLPKEDIYKIPVFVEIKDKEYIDKLNQNLKSAIRNKEAVINISELDIVGATEIFNSNDEQFIIKYKRKEKIVTVLSIDEIRKFCKENKLDYCETVLDIAVVCSRNGVAVVTYKVNELIDYTLDSEKCLLSKGRWYKYNDDYLMYLKASLSEIETEYLSEYDFTTKKHNDYIEYLYQADKSNLNDTVEEKNKKISKLKNKHYKERAFNEMCERDNGFKNYDRKGISIGKERMEAMDLYKDQCMYAVKFGNASSKLCYAVDQSLTSLKLLKMGELKNMPSITKVALWFVLERETHIEDSSGIPDINNLEMLMLKNSLDHWKKEVRLQGYTPKIYISYKKD